MPLEPRTQADKDGLRAVGKAINAGLLWENTRHGALYWRSWFKALTETHKIDDSLKGSKFPISKDVDILAGLKSDGERYIREAHKLASSDELKLFTWNTFRNELQMMVKALDRRNEAKPAIVPNTEPSGLSPSEKTELRELGGLLSAAMAWDNTMEGHLYWNKVHTALRTGNSILFPIHGESRNVGVDRLAGVNRGPLQTLWARMRGGTIASKFFPPHVIANLERKVDEILREGYAKANVAEAMKKVPKPAPGHKIREPKRKLLLL